MFQSHREDTKIHFFQLHMHHGFQLFIMLEVFPSEYFLSDPEMEILDTMFRLNAEWGRLS
jgi:hypothetical protein